MQKTKDQGYLQGSQNSLPFSARECLAVLSWELIALMRDDFPTPEGPAVTETLDSKLAARSSKPMPELALRQIAL